MKILQDTYYFCYKKGGSLVLRGITRVDRFLPNLGTKYPFGALWFMIYEKAYVGYRSHYDLPQND